MKLLFELYGKYKFKQDGWFRLGKIYPHTATKQEIDYDMKEALRQRANEHKQMFSYCIGLNNRVYYDNNKIVKNKALLQIDWDETPYYAYFYDLYKIMMIYLNERQCHKTMITNKYNDDGTINAHLICFEPITIKKIHKILRNLKHVHNSFKQMAYKNKNTTIRISPIKYGKQKPYEITKECLSTNYEEQMFYQIVKNYIQNTTQEPEHIPKMIIDKEPSVDYITLTEMKT